MSAQLRALRQLLADRFPEARPLVERDALRLVRPVATGVATLDGVFPHGGLPRGSMTVWAPDGGASAVLRAACRAVAGGGERAAWVDASGTLTYGWARTPWERRSRPALPTGRPAASEPRARRLGGATGSDWEEGTPLVVQSADRLSALRSAELLLRSGAFALVVLDGAEPEGSETVRLVRAVRAGGGAFVALTERTNMATLRVTSRLNVHGVRWRHGPFGDPAAPVDVRVAVRARSLGWNAQAEVVLPVAAYDLRCALEPGLADRRGGG